MSLGKKPGNFKDVGFTFSLQSVHAALHYNKEQCSNGNSNEGTFSPNLPYYPPDGFHRYGVIWSPPAWAGGGNDTLSFYVDDLFYFTSYNISSKIPINFGECT